MTWVDVDRTGERFGRAIRIAAVAVLALHVVLAWSTRQTAIGVGHDDAQYLLLGESLKHWGYHDVFLTDAPAHHMYPPGYPTILMLWGLVVGQQVGLLAVANIIASTVALALVFVTVERLWAPALGLAALGILAVNPHVVSSAGRLASETPYAFFSVLALWALAFQKPSGTLLALAGLASIGAALTRPIGVTLLAAVCLHWLLERRVAAVLGLIAGAACTVGSWLVWSMLAPHRVAGRSYVADASLIVPGEQGALSAWALLLRNAAHAAYDYVCILIPDLLQVPSVPGTMVDNAVFVGVLALALGCGLLACARRWRAAALYVLLYGGLLIVWPWRMGRFAEPLLPLLVPMALVGMAVLGRGLGPAFSGFAILVFALTLTINGSPATAGLARDGLACPPNGIYPDSRCLGVDRAGFFEALRYIDANLPRGAVLRSGKPATLYYYTGRKSLSRYVRPADPQREFLALLRKAGVGYILLDHVHVSSVRFARELKQQCQGLALEASFPPRTYLFRVLQEDGPVSDWTGCPAIQRYLEAHQADPTVR